MSTLTQFFGGGGGGGTGVGIGRPVEYADSTSIPNDVTSGTYLFRASTTFTPTTSIVALVSVGGGGGGGGARAENNTNANVANYYQASGGAGAFCQSKLTLNAGTTYTITVGARGNGARAQATNGNANGSFANAGGTSSFSGTGITTMTANGGGAPSSGNTGGSGGTASGGTIVNRNGNSANAGSTLKSSAGYINFSGDVGTNQDVSSDQITIALGGAYQPSQYVRDLTVGDNMATRPPGKGGDALYSSTNATNSGLRALAADSGSWCGGGAGCWYEYGGTSTSCAYGGDGGSGFVLMTILGEA